MKSVDVHPHGLLLRDKNEVVPLKPRLGTIAARNGAEPAEEDLPE